MRSRSVYACLLPAGLLFWAAQPAQSQDYPVKPIRMVASEAGGAGDIAARIITQRISGPLGQQVIVDNHGGGVIPAQTAARAQPDGYTVLFHGSGLWLLPFMRDSVPWDPLRDFAPITLAITSPNLLVVHPSLPVNSVQELIALAKARPGELNDGGGQTGSSTHLTSELFKAMAGINMVRIPYKGVGPALTALAGGEVQLSFTNPGAAAAHVKSGRIRAMAVTSAKPSAVMPGMPTIAASGLPGYEAVSIFGAFAPAGTPAAIIQRLNLEMVRALTSADIREKFLSSGVETVGSSPGELAATVKAEMARMGKVIKDRGIRDQ